MTSQQTRALLRTNELLAHAKQTSSPAAQRLTGCAKHRAAHHTMGHAEHREARQ